MESVGVGIIGSGFMGRTHSEAVSRYVQGAHLVAVAGGSRAPQLAADYGVDLEESVESLLKRADLQAVIVTSPHAAHAEQTIMAAKYGKHVLVEKPMATSIEDCDAMIEACTTAGVNLMAGQSQRYRRGNMIAKRLIQDGAIGRILMVEELQLNAGGLGKMPTWQSGQENVGTMLGYGVHNLDRLLWFVEDKVEWVSGITTSYLEEAPVEASSALLIKFRGGVAATLWCTFECPGPGFPNMGFRARVMGDKGMLDVDGFGLTKLGTGDGWEIVYEQPQFDFRADPLAQIRLESFSMQAQEFINSIGEGRAPAITGEDGRAAVEIALAAHLASATGAAVRLPLERA